MNTLKSFAIVIVGYDRLDSIKRLLCSLERVDYDKRKDITIIFSIDYNKNSEVLEFAKGYNWQFGKKLVRTFEKRQGLKNHILSCGEFTMDYDIISILEDDIYVSDSFYHYAFQAANFYHNDDTIAGISLYNFQKKWTDWIYRFEVQKKSFDTYFMKIAQSWGQVWTFNKWQAFKKWYDLNTEFVKHEYLPQPLNNWSDNSWLKFHTLYCIENNKYFIYPYYSLSTNFSDVGNHVKFNNSDYQVELQSEKKNFFFPKLCEDSIVYDEFMERVGLGKYLGIPECDLCVNIYGKKNKNHYKKYLLTTLSLNYLIINTFPISLRPIELSVIYGLPGKDIFLYNTEETNTNRNNEDSKVLLKHSLRTSDFRQLLKYSFEIMIISISNKLKDIFHNLKK